MSADYSAGPGADRVVGVFAKWPAPGAVKTRLSGADPDWGARLAFAFLQDILNRLAGLAARRVIAYAPGEAAAEFAALAGGRFELVPQAGGDLGQRLADFIDKCLAAGAGAIVVVGADSPTLPPEFISRAFELLQTADVVLGPACDGGYYLLG